MQRKIIVLYEIIWQYKTVSLTTETIQSKEQNEDISAVAI